MSEDALSTGDVIQIMYKCWRHDGNEPRLADVWLRATIIAVDPEGRPLAELADGQLTEIRCYMPWKVVAKGNGGVDRFQRLRSMIGGDRLSHSRRASRAA